MPSLLARFRSWLVSVQFAVTAGAVAVAVVAAGAVIELAPGTNDGLYVLFIAGVAAPGIYEEFWPTEYDRRAIGFAFGAVAGLVLAVAYLALATALRAAVADPVASIAAFVATWLAGIIAARAVEQGETAPGASGE
jgi:uncharacterized membrane protein